MNSVYVYGINGHTIAISHVLDHTPDNVKPLSHFMGHSAFYDALDYATSLGQYLWSVSDLTIVDGLPFFHPQIGRSLTNFVDDVKSALREGDSAWIAWESKPMMLTMTNGRLTTAHGHPLADTLN